MRFKNAHTGTLWKLPNGRIVEVLEKGEKVKLGFVGDFGRVEQVIEVDGDLDYNVSQAPNVKGDVMGSPAYLTYQELKKGGTTEELLERLLHIKPYFERIYIRRLITACLTELRTKDKLYSTLLPDGSVFYKMKIDESKKD